MCSNLVEHSQCHLHHDHLQVVVVGVHVIQLVLVVQYAPLLRLLRLLVGLYNEINIFRA